MAEINDAAPRQPSLSDLGLKLRALAPGFGSSLVASFYALFLGTVTGKGARISLINAFEKEFVIKQYRSKALAEQDLPNIFKEMDESGYYAWAELHGVPQHFELMQQ